MGRGSEGPTTFPTQSLLTGSQEGYLNCSKTFQTRQMTQKASPIKTRDRFIYPMLNSTSASPTHPMITFTVVTSVFALE